jgi:hypothetical protein
MDSGGDVDVVQGCLCPLNARLKGNLPIHLRSPPPNFHSILFIKLINTFSLLPSLMQVPCYDGICGSAGGNSPAFP